MCGLVGHVLATAPAADVAAVAAGSQLLAHRGPDGSGQVDLPHCSLAHRRLSIIDLEGSPQPWFSDCGRYCMVFNGEIYNYQELRKELQARNHVFRSSGDTEVLMKLFVEYGEACLEKLNGMFAFAVWDRQEKSLFLARDRLGEKPLYYAEGKEQLAFASELPALGHFDFIERRLDARAVSDYFAHQFIGQERSIWSGIRKLPPAHKLWWRNGRTEISRYWQLPLREDRIGNQTDWCEELRFLLEDSVRMRLRADVPLGVFLSGGLDSSLVAGVVKALGQDVRAFTMGFRDGSYDESTEAQEAARLLGIEQKLEFADRDEPEQLDRILDAFGEPYADPSAVPTWNLCRFARKDVTVALSGDGVDELFGGYRRYYARWLLRRLPLPPHWLQGGLMERLVQALPETASYYGNNPVKKLKLLYGMISRMAQSPGDPLAQPFSLKERRRLLRGGLAESETFDFVTDLHLQELDPVSRMMVADQQTYLAEDILVKVDRMSMQHGLEVRNPFLDHRLVEFAAGLPLEQKIRGNKQKYIVRSCYGRQLPASVLQRGKHGFSVPLGCWFRERLREPFQALVLEGRTASDILNMDEVATLWRQHQGGRADHGFKLWTIYVFCHWYHRHLSS